MECKEWVEKENDHVTKHSVNPDDTERSSNLPDRSAGTLGCEPLLVLISVKALDPHVN